MKRGLVLVIILTLFLLSGCMKLEGAGMASITGNVVKETVTAPLPVLQPIEKREKPTNQQAIETILEEEKQEEGPCQDECTPKGQSCTGTREVSCRDTDFDGCLEFQEVQCIHGCEGNACRLQRKTPKPLPPTQEEVNNEREDILTEENCSGNIIGTVQWNPHGALCRKEKGATTTRGLLKPVHCCSKFHYQSKCTKNLGIIRRGLSTNSQFFAVGCYD
jgi:predicted small secreted protein